MIEKNYVFFLLSNFFFFFKFKMSLFSQNESYDHKIHRQGRLGSKLKIGRWKFEKNSYLLIFDDFGKKVGFLSKFAFYEDYLWNFFSWETDKHKKKYHNLVCMSL